MQKLSLEREVASIFSYICVRIPVYVSLIDIKELCSLPSTPRFGISGEGVASHEVTEAESYFSNLQVFLLHYIKI